MLDRVKVYGISVHNNVRRGYIKTDVVGLRTKRVEGLGRAAWSTINIIDEAKNKNILSTRGII